jgi:hypothetical protein
MRAYGEVHVVCTYNVYLTICSHAHTIMTLYLMHIQSCGGALYVHEGIW